MLFSKSGHCYETLIVPIRHEVHNFARKLCRGDQATADDVLQETLLKSWKKWEEWEPSHVDNVEGSARAWLFRIASNVFISLCRTRKLQRTIQHEKRDEMVEGLHGVFVVRNRRVEPCIPPHDDNFLRESSSDSREVLLDPTPTASVDFDSSAVKEAIGRLHPQRQALLNMRYVKRQKLSEIARSLQVPASSVRVRLVRAHSRLRPLLAHHAREEWGLRGAGVQLVGETPEVIKAETSGVDAVVRDDDTSTLLLR